MQNSTTALKSVAEPIEVPFLSCRSASIPCTNVWSSKAVLFLRGQDFFFFLPFIVSIFSIACISTDELKYKTLLLDLKRAKEVKVKKKKL